MFNGSRRLLWTFNALLLIAAALVFRPLRTWIDQAIIARAIHPNLRIEEIHLHPNRLDQGLSVVEARQFDWASVAGNQRFGISADRAWLVIENAPLVSKQLVAPKALLEHARLYLETINPTTDLVTLPSDGFPPGSLWQQHLNHRFGDLDWTDLKQHLDGVLKLDEFSSSCNQQIESWVSSMQRLGHQAQALIADHQSLENPLRDHLETRGKLVSLERMIDDDAKLRSELQELDQQIGNKLQQIGALFDSQRAEIDQQAELRKAKAAADLAAEVIERASQRVFDKFKAEAQVIELLCRATSGRLGFGTSENYRSEQLPILSFHNVAASGIFASSDTKAPFLLKSQCFHTTKAPFGITVRSNFRYQFDAFPHCMLATVYNRVDRPEIIDLQISIASASNEDKIDLAGTNREPKQMLAPQWVLSSDGSCFEGELCIDETLLALLQDENDPVIRSLFQTIKQQQDTDASQQQFLVMTHLQGSWDSPRWKVNRDTIPDWFKHAAEVHVKEQIERSQQQMVQRMQRYIHTQIDQLSEQLEKQLDLAKRNTDVQSQELLAAKKLLEQSLNSGNTTEFARSNQEEVTR